MPSKKEVKGKQNHSNGDEHQVVGTRMEWADLSPKFLPQTHSISSTVKNVQCFMLE